MDSRKTAYPIINKANKPISKYIQLLLSIVCFGNEETYFIGSSCGYFFGKVFPKLMSSYLNNFANKGFSIFLDKLLSANVLTLC